MVSFRFTVFLMFNMFFASISSDQVNAMRPLGVEKWLRQQVLLLESLPRGPVPPSKGSPCTYIPGQGGGHCTLKERHFAAGGSVRAPSASPRSDIGFLVEKDQVKEKDSAS
ncbi:hypothetical protein Pfo_026367 [Paulownia fortunei]|nr:hypothetical protein Pfo_026367 [Paulownia fortunei]